MRPAPRLLLVQTGTVAAPAVRTSRGDYTDWFMRSLGQTPIPIVAAYRGERLDEGALERHRPQGILVTGSPLSLTQPSAWMSELGDTLHELGRRGLPILGVCFGHQLLCLAAGVQVVRNPRGREIGTVRVRLTAEGKRDPLLAWVVGDQLAVQATHEDAVAELPASARLLAGNENTAIQAVRFSEAVASVQFHPEIDAQTMREVTLAKAEALAREGRAAQQLADAVEETGSVAILRAFAEQAAHA